MKRTTLILAALALLLGVVAEARPDLIPNHAETIVSGQISGRPKDDFSLTDTQPLDSTQIGMASDQIGDSTASVTVLASSRILENLWELYTDVEAGASQPSLRGVFDVGRADAYWQDILFLDSTDPNVVGGTLRLYFLAIAFVDTNSGPTATAFTESATFRGGLGSGGGGSATSAYPSARGWDSFVGDVGGSFIGQFHVDVPIIPGSGYVKDIPGSFFYVVRSTTIGEVDDGNRTDPLTSASCSLQFLSITLPDMGDVTPESLGVSVTFDSGISSPNP